MNHVFSRRLVAAFAAAGLVAVSQVAAAQGLESEDAISTIVGSEVKTEQATAEVETPRILSAIENTPESIEKVRRAFNLGEIEIVFVPGLGTEETVVAQAVLDNHDRLQDLRRAIEGSAIFYHAIDSHQIMLRDVIAAEFGEENTVTIFVAGEEPA